MYRVLASGSGVFIGILSQAEEMLTFIAGSIGEVW